MAEQSTHNPKIKGLNPSTGTRVREVKKEKEGMKPICLCQLVIVEAITIRDFIVPRRLVENRFADRRWPMDIWLTDGRSTDVLPRCIWQTDICLAKCLVNTSTNFSFGLLFILLLTSFYLSVSCLSVKWFSGRRQVAYFFRQTIAFLSEESGKIVKLILLFIFLSKADKLQ